MDLDFVDGSLAQITPPVTRFARLFRSQAIQIGLVLLAALALLNVHYGPTLREPQRHLFSGNGDGLKNYYVFGYHVLHDSTWMQFGGMNHPFGEQIGYPDAQPVLSNSVKLLSFLFPTLAQHTVAVVNLATLFSIILTVLSIHLIFVHLRVPWIYAGLCALAVAALTPQTLRMQAAHHGLSYGWTITFALYFFMRTMESARPWRWAMAGALVTFIGLYLHPYTGMIAAAWLGMLLALLFPRLIRRKQWSMATTTGALVIGPVILFLLIQGLTDHHVGRTERPLGFFDYRTTWNSVLSPPSGYRSPLSWWVLPWNMPQEFEGSAYLGLGALLGTAVLLPVLLIRLVRRYRSSAEPHDRAWWPGAIVLASLPLLAFSFGAPFSESNGPHPWSFPFLGQFRSPGRFAWAAYYAFAIAVCYGAWWSWRHAEGAWRCVSAVFMGTIPFLYLYEANAMHVQVSESIQRDRNVLQPTGLTAEERLLIQRVDPNVYRAIIPLPHFLAGSDELLVMPQDQAMHTAMVLSYWTGLPMTAYSLARTSVSETREQLGLLSSPWYDRPIKEHYASDDRFLLLVVGQPANDEERRYIQLAHPVAAVGDLRLLELSAAELFRDRTEDLFQMIDRIADPAVDGTMVTTAAQGRGLHYGLDDEPEVHVYHGNGSYGGVKGTVNTLVTIPPHELVEGMSYVASYWAYNRGLLRCHSLTCVAQREPDSGKEDWISCGDIRFARIINGDWSLMELPFTVSRDEDQYRIFAEGKATYTDSIWCDEVVVRPAGALTFMVLQREEGRCTKVLCNGHILTRPR